MPSVVQQQSVANIRNLFPRVAQPREGGNTDPSTLVVVAALVGIVGQHRANSRRSSELGARLCNRSRGYKIQLSAASRGKKVASMIEDDEFGDEGPEEYDEEDAEDEVEAGDGEDAEGGGTKATKTAIVKRKTGGLRGGGGEAYSLVAIRIVTGRRHQIRVHTAHVGHPTVTDGKYTAAATFNSDRQWCPRNCLHRYRLAFRDSTGQLREAIAPLPEDLQEALGHMSARDEESSKELSNWQQGKQPKDWAKYEVLHSGKNRDKDNESSDAESDGVGAWVCPGCGAKNIGPAPSAEARYWSAPKTGQLCYKCGAAKSMKALQILRRADKESEA